MMKVKKNRCYNFVLILTPFLYCCGNASKSCSVTDDMKLLQEYQHSEMFFRLYVVNHGAFGETVTLRGCKVNKNEFVEEIELRGDDYRPKIDSVVGRNVYLHYLYPRDSSAKKIEDIDFYSVVLGEALLNKKTLRYNYIFKSISRDE